MSLEVPRIGRSLLRGTQAALCPCGAPAPGAYVILLPRSAAARSSSALQLIHLDAARDGSPYPRNLLGAPMSRYDTVQR